MTTRVAILISGGGSNMVRLIESMAADDHPGRPVIVISNRPDAAGLGKARALGVETAVLDHRTFGKDRAGFEAALAEILAAHAADIICLAGFMRVLGPEFVNKYQGRILNIHPSLLPKYKGLDTHARAIQAGDAHAGCSVHIVTPALDDGPVLGQASVPILPGDAPEVLASRVLAAEHQLYPQVLRDYLTARANEQ